MKFNDKSRIYGFISPRGSGKTATATYFSALNMANGIEVVSNLPIKGKARNKNGDVVEVQTIPFKFSEWLRLTDWHRNKHLLLDEVNFLLASRRGNSNVNWIWQGILQQIRHFNISITYTCINWIRVDTELRNETDVRINCRNAVYSHWGRKNNVDPGEYIELFAYDLSGILTGRMFNWKNPELTPPCYSILRAKPVWDHYDTENWVDPMLGMADVQIKKDRFMYDARHDDDDHEESQAEAVEYNMTMYEDIASRL